MLQCALHPPGLPHCGVPSGAGSAAASHMPLLPSSQWQLRLSQLDQPWRHGSVPSGRYRRRVPLARSPRSFMGTLDMVPGWLMPSWLMPEPATPRDVERRQRVRQLRQQLKTSGRAPALVLPPPPGEEAGVGAGNGDEAAGTGSGGTLDVAHSASNAVPFYTGAPAAAGAPCSAAAAASSLSVALNGGAASVSRAEEVRQVLPWLFAAEGRLDFSAMEWLASQLALSGLQLLDVARFSAAASAANGHWHSSWGSHVRWAGAQALPSPAVAAAAALRRMELRRGGALSGLPEIDGKAVVLTFHPQHRQLAAETLAIYLHTFLGLSGQEAVEAAGRAVGTSPLEGTLLQYLEELATIADGWYRRVTLAWPYAGGHVEVVGDAVGGWDQRAPMVFNVKKKRWQLQIWGLQPGIHRFKYLVDGCWVIDLAGHTEADARGNINNVVMVTSTGRPLLRRARAGGSATDSTDDSDSEGEDAAAYSSSSSSSSSSGGVGSNSGGGVQQPGVLATGEPPEAAAAAGQQQQQQGAVAPSPPWRSPEEMEAMARFGAAVLAFNTRLGVQLRHKLH